jgi:hypothetical protein
MLSPQAKHPRAKRLVQDMDGRVGTDGFAGGSFASHKMRLPSGLKETAPSIRTLPRMTKFIEG